MTPERKAELRGLCEGATDGPWTECGHDRGGCVCRLVYSLAADTAVAQAVGLAKQADDVEDYCAAGGSKEDARFIAAARTALPELLDEVDRLESELRQATAAAWIEYDRPRERR